jgi:hypothetical protein
MRKRTDDVKAGTRQSFYPGSIHIGFVPEYIGVLELLIVVSRVYPIRGLCSARGFTSKGHLCVMMLD